ncbi:D-methionine transport system substrate-binding protein [Pseudochelatococcus lubricantis]|uniref:Lipoprotein n=1 Tax=Pseudochelatococcus lubricantis TaxID=1538102 RepID=A0ABX0UUE5_9HYPH|nr:MetQ/NlpA family ABC transporter substrate-binding protein [Pseudochelatococcus lubricantis]NIJ56588.1 D-methionine transport system substrate-binding protein [Pseudochelatococcus lubricantis]
MSRITRRIATLTIGAVLAGVAALSSAQAADKIKLGVIGGEEEEIAEVVKKVAATKGLDVELVTFADYSLPNEALARGDLDANAFQHKPYLDAQIAARGYKIVPIGYTIVQPIGFYSKKHKTFADLPEGASIGIPNDPSNGARALKLLAANGLIKLKDPAKADASPLDVSENPKKVSFKELDAALITKQLDDLDGAVINTTYALGAGLNPVSDALVQESRTNNPYGNFIAVRTEDKDKPALKTLVEAYQSKEVSDFLETRFKGSILPAW